MAAHACIFQVSFGALEGGMWPPTFCLPHRLLSILLEFLFLLPRFSLLPSEGDQGHLLEGAMRQKVTHGRAVFGKVLGT